MHENRLCRECLVCFLPMERTHWWWGGGGGGGAGGFKLPASRTLKSWFLPCIKLFLLAPTSLHFFRLQNIAQCCIIFLFSHFPPRWESLFSPPLLLPPVHLLLPFLLVSHPPVPLPPCTVVEIKLETDRLFNNV